MRISDWSSDVCSSDLAPGQIARVVFDAVAVTQLHDHFQIETRALLEPLRLHQLVLTAQVIEPLAQLVLDLLYRVEQDRKSVVEGKSVSVRVDHGGRRIIKQNKNRP